MNVKEQLDRLRFRTFNVHGLITDVREYIDLNGTIGHSKLLVRSILGREIEFRDELEARIFVKKMMVEIFNTNFVVNPVDIDAIIDECWVYTKSFVTDPKWSFLSVDVIPEQVDEVTGVVVPKVLVPKEGKKESKQDIVRRWYKEFVIDSGMISKDFGLKLVGELGMTKAGSLTYVHNAKKYWDSHTA